MLPDGFALSEWLVLAEASVQSPIGKRRDLVDTVTAEGGILPIEANGV